MKNLLLKIQQNVWLLPGVYCLVASLLAIGVIYLDTVHGETIVRIFPATLLISVGLAQTILRTIAAALLTMIAITFSTIMVVLTTYSSQFSPRTLTDFITNKVTMRVLGVYMGGFMYSILTLLFTSENITHEVLAGTIGVAIAIVCLGFFAFFIQHVAASIQVSNLINKETTATLKTIKDRITTKKEGIIKITSEKPNLSITNYSTLTIENKRLGYLQLIEYQHLLEVAMEKDLILEVRVPAGMFVKPGDSLLTIYYKGEKPAINFQKYFKVGNDRTMIQDVEFGIRKIVEITLRAISPGINDPNTAIDCLFHLGQVLAEASKQDGRYINYYDEEKVKVIGVQTNFDDILYGTFYQICHYGREDISILLAIYDSLISISEENDLPIRKKVWQFSNYVSNNFKKEVLQEMDLQYLNVKKVKLSQMLIK